MVHFFVNNATPFSSSFCAELSCHVSFDFNLTCLPLLRYLDVYERIHFLGEEVDRRESELHEEDDARNRRKALRLLHATPTSYNTAQHLISGAFFFFNKQIIIQ